MTPDSTRERYTSPIGRTNKPQFFELSPQTKRPDYSAMGQPREGEFDRELNDIMQVDRDNRRRKAVQREPSLTCPSPPTSGVRRTIFKSPGTTPTRGASADPLMLKDIPRDASGMDVDGRGSRMRNSSTPAMPAFPIMSGEEGNSNRDSDTSGVSYVVVQHRHDAANRTTSGSRRQSPPLSICLLYTSPSPRDRTRSRMPSSA